VPTLHQPTCQTQQLFCIPALISTAPEERSTAAKRILHLDPGSLRSHSNENPVAFPKKFPLSISIAFPDRSEICITTLYLICIGLLPSASFIYVSWASSLCLRARDSPPRDKFPDGVWLVANERLNRLQCWRCFDRACAPLFSEWRLRASMSMSQKA
jgi:hypothetical protein